jgi:hypothetical protein
MRNGKSAIWLMADFLTRKTNLVKVEHLVKEYPHIFQLHQSYLTREECGLCAITEA